MIIAENNNYSSENKLKILNFYSENCPPCHAFMPNFIEAEKTFWKYFDFIAINSSNNLELFQKYRIMGTPTIIIMDWEKIVLNASWVPNWKELKENMIRLAWISEKDLETKKEYKKETKKRFFWFF